MSKSAPPTPAPPAAQDELAVAFDRIEPAEPHAGQAVSVVLSASGKDARGSLVFQYRYGGADEWQTAAAGRFSIKDVPPGPLLFRSGSNANHAANPARSRMAAPVERARRLRANSLRR